jgi:hypothetical protein
LGSFANWRFADLPTSRAERCGLESTSKVTRCDARSVRFYLALKGKFSNFPNFLLYSHQPQRARGSESTYPLARIIETTKRAMLPERPRPVKNETDSFPDFNFAAKKESGGWIAQPPDFYQR